MRVRNDITRGIIGYLYISACPLLTGVDIWMDEDLDNGILTVASF